MDEGWMAKQTRSNWKSYSVETGFSYPEGLAGTIRYSEEI